MAMPELDLPPPLRHAERADDDAGADHGEAAAPWFGALLWRAAGGYWPMLRVMVALAVAALLALWLRPAPARAAAPGGRGMTDRSPRHARTMALFFVNAPPSPPGAPTSRPSRRAWLSDAMLSFAMLAVLAAPPWRWARSAAGWRGWAARPSMLGGGVPRSARLASSPCPPSRCCCRCRSSAMANAAFDVAMNARPPRRGQPPPPVMSALHPHVQPRRHGRRRAFRRTDADRWAPLLGPCGDDRGHDGADRRGRRRAAGRSSGHADDRPSPPRATLPRSGCLG